MAGAQSCLIYIMVVIQLMGILSIVLIAVWLSKYGDDQGFGFDDHKGLLNLHSILMPIGAVFLPSNGIVLYRAFRKYQARKVKWAHFVFQLLSIIIIILGFTFAVMARTKLIDDFQNQGSDGGDAASRTGSPGENGDRKHFYSAHSWLGLMSFIMFVLQFLGGLFVFAFKVVDKSSRELFAAVHAFFGIFITLLSGFVAVVGIEGRAKTDITNYDKVVDAGILCNVAALAIVIMLAHVLYISVNPFFEWDVNDDTLEANPIE